MIPRMIPAFALLFASCEMKEPTHVVTGKEGDVMPKFSILLPDSSYFSTMELSSDKPTVLFYFSPICPYCRIQTRKIVDDAKALENINFLFIAVNQFDIMKKYYMHFELAKLNNVHVGSDTGYIVGNYFRTSKVPSIALYGSDNRLQAFYKGVVKTETMKALVK